MSSKRVFNIKDMCEIQDILNEHTIFNWKQELNSNHFITAIIDELAEFLGSVNWSWWKKPKKLNEWNLKIEAIDILHFSLSILILRGMHLSFRDYVLCQNSKGRNYMIDIHGKLDHNVFASHTVVLLMTNNVYLYQLNDFLDSIGMTAEEVSALYIAKAELNFIRQSNGYKTGEYVKVIDGKEDNERLEEIVYSFLNNKLLSLNDVKRMVQEEFFTKSV